jgi:hypothetical protein
VRVTQNPAKHRGAAARHAQAADTHDRAAKFWGEHGDHERAELHRDMAKNERQAAQLEQRWAELIDRDQKYLTPTCSGAAPLHEPAAS